MLLLFISLIALVRLSNNEVVLVFPEGRERIAAERVDRESNAFYILEAAQQMLPPRPENVAVPDEQYPDRPVLYQPTRYTYSETLGLAIPPDHPDMLQYLKDSGDAITLARTAIERPYFRYPYPASHWILRYQLPQNTQIGYVYGIWFAYGEAQVRYWGDVDGGIETLSDLWTALSKMDQEPLLIHSRWQYMPFHFSYFRMMFRLIRETEDSAVLDKLDDLLRNHPPVYSDLTPLFEAHMRALDDTLTAREILHSYGMETHSDFGDKFKTYQLQLVGKFYVQQVAHFQDPAALLPEAFGQWLTDSDSIDIPWSDYMDLQVALTLQEDLRRTWMAMDAPQVARITIALQHHFLEHDAYPGSLDELVPNYIDAIPESRTSSNPFTYEPGPPGLDVPTYSIHGTSVPQFGNWQGEDRFIPLEFIVHKDFF